MDEITKNLNLIAEKREKERKRRKERLRKRMTKDNPMFRREIADKVAYKMMGNQNARKFRKENVDVAAKA